MANKQSVFSTPRPDGKKPTAAEMLENLIQRKNMQAQNRKSLEEIQKIEATTPKYKATLESADVQAKRSIEETRLLEAMAYKQGVKNLTLQKFTLKPQVIQEGIEYLTNKFLAELVVESCWIDDDIMFHKDEFTGEYDTMERIGDNISSVLGYLEESFTTNRVTRDKYSPLLENVMGVIKECASKVADRIVKECDESDEPYEEFELNADEEEEFEDKLSELGRDEIVDLVKDKVMKIIQDEKKNGEERSEAFDDIEKATSDKDAENEDSDDSEDSEDEDSSDDENSDSEEESSDDEDSGDNSDDDKEDEKKSEESTNLVTLRKLLKPTLEGVNWDLFNTWLDEKGRFAVEKLKAGNKLFAVAEFKSAQKCYEDCKKSFEEISKKISDVPESFIGSVMSYLAGTAWGLLVFWRFFLNILPGQAIMKDLFGERGDFLKRENFGGYATLGNLDLRPEEISRYNKAFQNSKVNPKSFNIAKAQMLQQCKEIIAFCEMRIDRCKNPTILPYVEAVSYDLRGSHYSANEHRIAKLLENNQDVVFIHDPTWSEFKSFVSLNCKEAAKWIGLARSTPVNNCDMRYDRFCKALSYINLLEAKLSDVPEGMPADVKSYTMALMNMIYMAIPSDEIIISRFGSSLGSPETRSTSPSIDWESVSWTDLFVNIKTNFASIKSYCVEQMDCKEITSEKLNNSECPDTGRDAIAQLIATKQIRAMTQNIGSSLFEAIMVGQLKLCDKIAMESTNIEDKAPEVIENAALIESVLYYTIFETINTIGLYKFDRQDMSKIKQRFMFPVTEAQDEKGVKGINSNKKLMSLGKGKNGLKKVRINTKRLQKKRTIKASSEVLKAKH